MIELDLFFPTAIGTANNLNHREIQDQLVEHCLKVSTHVQSGGNGWMSNKTYNTSNGKYDVVSDEIFSTLNHWVITNVKNYCDMLDIESHSLVNNGSWFNIYRKHDYQENHVHPTSVISAIYILCCDNMGARVFFNSPVNDMYYVKKSVKKKEMVDQLQCQSIPGTLIIFPSYLNHAVEKHESDQLRISISYNFKQS